MSSPPVTFPCPFCTRRMGVPAELLGRQVRCPHCKQVLVAPATASAPAPAPAVVNDPPPQLAPAPVPQPEPELRAFNIPQGKEGADSIMSEADESEDEVFGSPRPKRLSLEPLPPTPASEPQSAPDDPFGFGPLPTLAVPPTKVTKPFVVATLFDPSPNTPSAPAPAEPSIPPPVKTELLNPFSGLEPPALKAAAPPAPAPLPKAAPLPRQVPLTAPHTEPTPPSLIPAPIAPTGGNPFAEFEAPIPVPAPMKGSKPALLALVPQIPLDEAPPRKKPSAEDQDEDRDDRPARAGRALPATSPAGGGAKTILLVLLAGYAFVATAVAVYGLFFKSGGSGAPDTGHPLSTIPDNFGEFDPVSRKKVAQLKFPVDGELPAAQRAGLGGKIVIGQLEVEPIRVRKRPLQIAMEGTNEKDKLTSYPGMALVLTLAIKNTSSDLSIFPMDPAFTRRATKSDQPITRLVVGPKVFLGGEIEWPLSNRFKKKIEVQQANDSKALEPNRSQEYIVFTEANTDLVKTAEASKELLQWRIQVRRGLIDYKGKEVPVTAVIGVDFKASDIKDIKEPD